MWLDAKLVPIPPQLPEEVIKWPRIAVYKVLVQGDQNSILQLAGAGAGPPQEMYFGFSMWTQQSYTINDKNLNIKDTVWNGV